MAIEDRKLHSDVPPIRLRRIKDFEGVNSVLQDLTRSLEEYQELVRQITTAQLEQVSSDRGDNNVTLVALVDERIQIFATTLTANRTVTLSTTDAANSDRFRIVRTGLGAFTLDVGGLKTIPSATAAFVDVHYNGSAWVLTGYGTL